MKEERILDALGKVEDRYVAEAESGEIHMPKRFTLLRAVAVAACVCLVLGTIMILWNPDRGGPTMMTQPMETTDPTVIETTIPVETRELELTGEALSEDKLGWFQVLLTQQRDNYADHPVNWYATALEVQFEEPEQLNPFRLFRRCMESTDDLSKEELDWLNAQGADTNQTIFRMTRSEMDEILQRYFGVTMKTVSNPWASEYDDYYYNADTDCYYTVGIVYGLPGTMQVVAGEKLNESTFRIYYAGYYNDTLWAVTMRSLMQEGAFGYIIESNVPTEFSIPEDVEVSLNQGSPIQRAENEGWKSPEVTGQLLDADTLDWYQMLFTQPGASFAIHPTNWYNMALNCLFEDPADLNLELLFYNGTDERETISQAEREYAISQGAPEYSDLQRLTVEGMDAVLTQYFGVTFGDISVWTKDEAPAVVCYNPDTNAYYLSHGDYLCAEEFNILFGESLDDGVIKLYYTMDDFIHNAKTLYCITMRSNRGQGSLGYTILSNVEMTPEIVYTAPQDSGERMGYTTNEDFLAADGCVFFFEDEVLYKVEDGVKTVAYEGSHSKGNANLTTNGENVLFVDDRGMVIALDVETCQAQELFFAGEYDFIAGATEDTILLYKCENPSTWFEMTVDVYDWNGNALDSYGKWDVTMKNGYLVQSSRRSDVGFRYLTVYSPEGELLVEKEVMWTYTYCGGAIYFAHVDLETFDEESTPECAVQLCRVDRDGMTTIATLNEATRDGLCWLMNGLVAYTDSAGIRQYMTFTGQQVEQESILSASMRWDTETANVNLPNRLFYVDDPYLYLQNEKGGFDKVTALPTDGGWGVVIYAIEDGYVYCRVNSSIQWVELP